MINKIYLPFRVGSNAVILSDNKYYDIRIVSCFINEDGAVTYVCKLYDHDCLPQRYFITSTFCSEGHNGIPYLVSNVKI